MSYFLSPCHLPPPVLPSPAPSSLSLTPQEVAQDLPLYLAVYLRVGDLVDDPPLLHVRKHNLAQTLPVDLTWRGIICVWMELDAEQKNILS